MNVKTLLSKMSLKEKIFQLEQFNSVLLKPLKGWDATGPMRNLGLTESDLTMTGTVLNSMGAERMKDIQADFLEKNENEIPLAFMHDYFELLRKGDHNGINAMYCDGYFDGEEKKPYEAFPMQKIYDVLVCKYDHRDENFEKDPSVTATYYLVTYKIMENDGLFRYELDSDVEQTQLFGILTYADGTSEIYLLMDLPNVSIIRTF